jgi:tRNA (cmo5U34)-methyltransferase
MQMNDITSTEKQWNEDDSANFIDLSAIFVPGRAEQTATLLRLIPARHDEDFTIVELASGEGMLAQAILEAFPHCHYIALDGSEVMRQHLTQKLARFSDRLVVRSFDMHSQDWRTALPQPLRCVVSSLCVHHLVDAEKSQLFKDIATALEPGGALLLADIIQPANKQIADLFAQQYDDIVRTQSLELRGDLSGYEQFLQHKWNYFTYDYNDPTATLDTPSLLANQLCWLQEANFSLVDCFWMRAGHAVYGGFKI